MSAPSPGPLPDEAALNVFGSSKFFGRPHAAWFRAEDAAVAAWVADQLGLAVMAAAPARRHGAGLALSEWPLGRDAQPVIPLVAPATLEALRRLWKEPGAAPPPPRVPPATCAATVPATHDLAERLWTALTVKSVVLAPALHADSLPAGWWKAVTLAVHGEEFTLCWRDYPEHGLVRRQGRQIAPLPPEA